MSEMDDLREKLEHAFASSWSDESEYSGAVDAIMPTVREALAEAWDEGYEMRERANLHGVDAVNPWREADS